MHASRRFSTLPTSTLPILALALVAMAGCASATPRLDGNGVAGVAPALNAPGSHYSAPGARYPTVDEAAIAAFSHVAAKIRRSDADRLHVGSIVGVAGSYRWTWQTDPRERKGRRDDWRPKARLSLASDHVASFVIHPRTGERSIDRANEQVTRGERRIVDDLDPLHRPIYVLTPSGQIVSYRHRDSARTIADLRRGRPAASGCGERSREAQPARDDSSESATVALMDGSESP